jgi:hypothetical protein
MFSRVRVSREFLLRPHKQKNYGAAWSMEHGAWSMKEWTEFPGRLRQTP